MTSTTTLTPTGPLTLDYDSPFLDYAAPGDRWVTTPTSGRVTCQAASDDVASVDGDFVCTRLTHRAEQPHVAAGIYDVKAVWHDKPYVPAAGERVRVTSMQGRDPSQDYKDCVGRYGKVVRHSPINAHFGVVQVEFEDTRHPQRAYVTTTVAVPPLAPEVPRIIDGEVVKRLGLDLIGTRVRVVSRDAKAPYPDYDGHTGTIKYVDTHDATLPVKVTWDDQGAPRGEEGWVHLVERLDADAPATPEREDVPEDMNPAGVQAAADALHVIAERDRLREQVRVLRDQAASHQAWKDRLVIDAHQYADDNDFCSTFDDFMEEHDLPRRSRAYRVTTHVTVEVEIDIDIAADAADAEQQVNDMDRDDILRHVADRDLRDMGIVEHDAREARVI